jgi:hypothetical protein
MSTAPAFKIGKSEIKNFDSNAKSPGPGSYTPKAQLKANNVGFSRIGRLDLEPRRKVSTPGPAAYNTVPLAGQDMSSVSFSKTKRTEKDKLSPGPANYNTL